MKRVIFICLAAVLAASCSKATVEPYNSDNGVYFQLRDKWSDVTSDTVQFSFVKYEGITEKDVLLRVNLQGVPVDHDRKFALAIDTEHSTATEGVDYKALEPYYTMPAGEYCAYVPVTLYRTERIKSEILLLTVRVGSTDDLVAGLDNRLSAVIRFADQVIKPAYWDKYERTWGEWSQVKQLTVEEVCGWEFPETNEEFVANPFYDIMYAGSNYMNQYFKDHEVIDENGNVIQPWK